MTAPGWYNAQGDPPGTQRYWDGAQWIGEPQYEAAAPVTITQPLTPPNPSEYVAHSAPVGSSFPTGVKRLAIVVCVLKAMPLVFALLGAFWLAVAANNIEDEFDEFGFDFDNIVGAAIAILFVVIVIGGVLLGFQFAGAIKERPMMIFVPAFIMSVIDAIVSIAAWVNYFDARDSPFEERSAFGPLLVSAVAVLQVMVAVQALRANKR